MSSRGRVLFTVCRDGGGTTQVAMHLFEVKPKSQAKEEWDLYDLRATLASPQAFPPPGQFGCPLVPK